MCERFQDVVYILGNHEFYNQEVNEVKEFWQNVDMPINFTFLDDDVYYCEDIRIIGATLWTLVTDPHMRWQCRRMNDYQVIKINQPEGFVRKITVDDTDHAHKLTLQYMKDILDQPWKGKTIVMTHHLPHPLCVAEKFKGNDLNAFFMTDLDHLIEKYDIDYWCHGHTHDNVDIEVHGTRILCNPMGYHGVMLNQDFNEGLTFDT